MDVRKTWEGNEAEEDTMLHDVVLRESAFGNCAHPIKENDGLLQCPSQRVDCPIQSSRGTTKERLCSTYVLFVDGGSTQAATLVFRSCLE